jgi:protein-disulfide isomerase
MSKQARTEPRRARAAEQAAAERQRRLNRRLASVGGIVIVGLLVAIVAVVVRSVGNAGSSAATPTASVVAPANATTSGAIRIGQAAAPVRVEIYLDYMCPYCGEFERANSAEIRRLVQAGTARLELHPLSFLDQQSGGTRFSTRAANAMATVADRSPDFVLAFNEALFTEQPEEGSNGLSDEQIAALAGKAGVPQDVIGAFTSRTFEPWVAASTNAAFRAGITGTPTVKINGAVYKGDLYTVGPLSQAIEKASSGG